MINKPDIIVIGGLIFNNKPLIALNQLGHKVSFVDINNFTMPFNVSTVVKSVETQIVTSNNLVVIIGYSAGGIIAINLAINQPYLVYKLILVNSTPCFMSKSDWHGITEQNLSRLTSRLTTMSFTQFKKYFSQLSLYPKVHSSTELLKWQSDHCTFDTTKVWLEIIANSDMREKLNSLLQPILLLYSCHDHLVPNINYLASTKLQQYTMGDSSHAKLEEYQLIKYIGQFIL